MPAGGHNTSNGHDRLGSDGDYYINLADSEGKVVTKNTFGSSDTIGDAGTTITATLSGTSLNAGSDQYGSTRRVPWIEDTLFIALYLFAFPFAIWMDTQGSLWPLMGEYILNIIAWLYFSFFFFVWYHDDRTERARMVAVAGTFACMEVFATEWAHAYRYLRLVPQGNGAEGLASGGVRDVFRITGDPATQRWIDDAQLIYVHRLVPVSVFAGHWCMFDWCRRTTRLLDASTATTVQGRALLHAVLLAPLAIASFVLGFEDVDLFSVKALLPLGGLFVAASVRAHAYLEPSALTESFLSSVTLLAVTWWWTLLMEIYGTYMYCWRWDPHLGAILGWIWWSDFHAPNPPVLIGVLYTVVHLIPDGIVRKMGRR